MQHPQGSPAMAGDVRMIRLALTTLSTLVLLFILSIPF
jgi:hypothetical protein